MPTVAAIYPEVTVGGEEDGIAERFAYSDKTCIGEAHRHISIFLHQAENGFEISCEPEGDPHCISAEKSGERRQAARAEQVKSLGKSSLT